VSRRVDDLAGIQFTGAKSVAQYSKVSRKLCRDLALEFYFSADELEAVLIGSMKGNPLLAMVGAPDVRMRARRVARRLRRMGELLQGAAAEASKVNAQFRREFADILNPPKAGGRKKFDFKDD
jgi:hypothetical protein